MEELLLAFLALFAFGGGRSSSSKGSPAPKSTPSSPSPDPDPVPTPGGGEIDPRPRAVDSFDVPFARGASDPLWPLPQDSRSATPRGDWARGRVTADFGDARPFGSTSPSRHHAGEDLRAPRGSIIIATERGTITAIDEEWYEGTGAMLIHLDSGITANFGEIEPGSPSDAGLAVGSTVERGQTIARVGRTNMLHFELYTGTLRRTHQWPWHGAAPAELLDPTEYLELAAATVPA